uniref:Uncharacterized protein n=1 Tax=Fusarium oxysporum (strain Fo5176) TaxID=660025 RepID=A0A0D2Y862_FUSOF
MATQPALRCLIQVLKAPLNAVLETDESGGDIREGTFRRILESVISISIYGKSDKTDDDEEALKELKESSRVELQCGQWNLTAVVEKDTASSNVSLGHSGKASAIAAGEEELHGPIPDTNTTLRRVLVTPKSCDNSIETEEGGHSSRLSKQIGG